MITIKTEHLTRALKIVRLGLGPFRGKYKPIVQVTAQGGTATFRARYGGVCVETRTDADGDLTFAADLGDLVAMKFPGKESKLSQDGALLRYQSGRVRGKADVLRDAPRSKTEFEPGRRVGKVSAQVLFAGVQALQLSKATKHGELDVALTGENGRLALRMKDPYRRCRCTLPSKAKDFSFVVALKHLWDLRHCFAETLRLSKSEAALTFADEQTSITIPDKSTPVAQGVDALLDRELTKDPVLCAQVSDLSEFNNWVTSTAAFREGIACIKGDEGKLNVQTKMGRASAKTNVEASVAASSNDIYVHGWPLAEFLKLATKATAAFAKASVDTGSTTLHCTDRVLILRNDVVTYCVSQIAKATA